MMLAARLVRVRVDYKRLGERLGLPNDVSVIGHLEIDKTMFSPQGFELLLQSENFPDVVEGAVIPQAKIVYYAGTLTAVVEP